LYHHHLLLLLGSGLQSGCSERTYGRRRRRSRQGKERESGQEVKERKMQ
jgi:hypothetical protein